MVLKPHLNSQVPLVVRSMLYIELWMNDHHLRANNLEEILVHTCFIIIKNGGSHAAKN